MKDHPQEIRKNILFLSSSYVNLAKIYANTYPDTDVFLILDRKFPFEIEDLDNFYTYTFDKNKMFDNDKERYFDNLGIYMSQFNPDIIITNNFSKLLPQSFLDFFKFTNSKINFLNIHHADLRIIEEGDMKFKGLNADVKEFLDEAMVISTIHLIENDKMDEGKQLAFSHETTFKELKKKSFLNKKEDILNFRKRNLVRSYHERTKVLKVLRKVLDEL